MYERTLGNDSSEKQRQVSTKARRSGDFDVTGDQRGVEKNEETDSGVAYGSLGKEVSRKKREVEHFGSRVYVTCFEGFHGGLPQYFIIEARQRGELKANLTRWEEESVWIIIG